MIAAMDVVGNPSSVHAEGRAARSLMERARAQLATALGAEASDVVFVSGSTEAAALACAGRGLRCAGVEHDAVLAWCEADLPVDGQGRIGLPETGAVAVQLANSETGIVQDLSPAVAVSDLTQGFGKIPFAFDWSGVEMGFVSAHKIGGPKGVGALIIRRGLDLAARICGGGQEMGRRAGTENLIGIAGFGAAAEAASQDLANGIWDGVAELRNILEKALSSAANKTIFVGNQGPRLPNTLCLATPGWKGETQVMQMDLAGFAVSAGSACSSGKVRASRVLTTMGLDTQAAASAIRVSLGPAVNEGEVLRFADAWIGQWKRFGHRAAENV